MQLVLLPEDLTQLRQQGADRARHNLDHCGSLSGRGFCITLRSCSVNSHKEKIREDLFHIPIVVLNYFSSIPSKPNKAYSGWQKDVRGEEEDVLHGDGDKHSIWVN